MGLQKNVLGKTISNSTNSITTKQTLQTEELPTSAPTPAVLAEEYIRYMEF
jgi:hypothetical protein